MTGRRTALESVSTQGDHPPEREHATQRERQTEPDRAVDESTGELYRSLTIGVRGEGASGARLECLAELFRFGISGYVPDNKISVSPAETFVPRA